MDNKYLIILASLIGFFCIVLFYSKQKQSSFGKIEQTQPLNDKFVMNENVNHLDTRYDYPNTPPVNPNVYKTLIVSSEPVNSDLYDGTDVDSTNQLNYSGGSTQLLKIPLQFNEPYNEQLRSQEVLITPYNRIKYNTTTDNC